MREGTDMNKSIFCVFLLTICFGQALAQMQELAEFKGVNLPFALKSENVLLEKGKYDFILIKNLPNFFLLRIKKQGKTISLISGGEKIDYPGQGNLGLLQNNPDIPKFGKLTIKRDPTLRIAYIILETGKQAALCPLHKIRFKLDSLE